MTYVGKAPATPECKLLQLRQYLSGEALKVVEPLEQRKDRNKTVWAGGKKRQIALHLEELNNWKCNGLRWS